MEEITHISKKIGVIERRVEHLEARLRNEPHRRGIEYDQTELGALNAALVCMKLHRADAEGLNGPVNALRELLDSLGPVNRPGNTLPVRAAMRRAESVLQEWE